VLVACLAEQLQDLADPAGLADPVALNDHQVADLSSGRIQCLSHHGAPFSVSLRASLPLRPMHQYQRTSINARALE
jgi:hypothetical protein